MAPSRAGASQHPADPLGPGSQSAGSSSRGDAPEHAGRRSRWAMVAGLIVGLQGLVVLAFAVYYVSEQAKAYSLFNVLVSAALFVLSGAGLLLVAKGLLDGRGWARSPALTWEVVCLPVAWSLGQSGRWYVGLPVGLLTLLALAGLLLGVQPNRRSTS